MVDDQSGLMFGDLILAPFDGDTARRRQTCRIDADGARELPPEIATRRPPFRIRVNKKRVAHGDGCQLFIGRAVFQVFQKFPAAKNSNCVCVSAAFGQINM